MIDPSPHSRRYRHHGPGHIANIMPPAPPSTAEQGLGSWVGDGTERQLLPPDSGGVGIGAGVGAGVLALIVAACGIVLVGVPATFLFAFT